MLSVTADDDRTLTVTLDTAYENFSLMLDVPIVSAATVQSSTPLGTGPYYLDGEVLRRSSRWWRWCWSRRFAGLCCRNRCPQI